MKIDWPEFKLVSAIRDLCGKEILNKFHFFMQDTKYLMNQNKVDVAFAFTHFE